VRGDFLRTTTTEILVDGVIAKSANPNTVDDLSTEQARLDFVTWRQQPCELHLN
jgi:hypothetical protein